jgi:hypothetical protein
MSCRDNSDDRRKYGANTGKPAKSDAGPGEPGGIRTHGPKIKSLVLYQLSYGLDGAL